MRNIAFIGFILLAFYHLLILVGIINYEYVWGGNIDSLSSRVVLETIAFIITCYFIFLLIYLKESNQATLYSDSGLIFGVVVFTLSFIGNLLSNNDIEKVLGSSIAIFYIIYFLLEINRFKRDYKSNYEVDKKKTLPSLFGIIVYKEKS